MDADDDLMSVTAGASRATAEQRRTVAEYRERMVRAAEDVANSLGAARREMQSVATALWVLGVALALAVGNIAIALWVR